MRRHVLILVIVGLLASVTACGDQGEPVVEKDLAYATWNVHTLTLDMHVPGKPTGAPIVIYLPGSGGGDAPPELVDGLLEEGAMVFVARWEGEMDSVSKLLRDHGVRARSAADSVACAILFARARASEFDSDDPVVVLTGFSLGGGPVAHAALYGGALETRWDAYAAEGGPPRQDNCEVADGSTDVDALVGIAGAYDVFVPAYEGLYGRAYQQENDPDLWSFLAGAVGVNPDLKVRLIHGTSDGTIPYENSADFAAMLTDAGYDVALTSWDGGHLIPVELAVETIKKVLRR